MSKIKFGIILCFLLLLTACTDAQKTSEYDETRFNDLEKENEHLKEEISDYSVYLQNADGTSRRILRLISEGEFEQLKSEYNADFEVSNGQLIFTKLDKPNAGFPIEQANLPMFVAYLNMQSEFIEIGYFLDDLNTDERYSITFSYDKDGNFKYIFVGDN